MFDFLKGVKVQLTVELDRQVYAPGDTLHARITLKNDKELKIQGGRFVVICQEKYQYKRRDHDSDGDSSIEKTWGTHDIEAYRFDFLPELPLPPGTHNFETSCTLGADALPSSKGDILSVAWFAKATLDRKMAADTNTEVPFTLLTTKPPDTASATSGTYGVSNEPAEAEMSLVLRTKQVTGGVTFTGSLRVMPQKDFTASEVRLEFVRDEHVADVVQCGHDNRKETVLVGSKLAGRTQMQAGQYQEYPFSITLPQGLAPSVEFEAATLKYMLKGILARTLRKDTHVDEEVKVFAG